MTPAEAKAMTLPEYLALAHYMDRDLKQQQKAARKRGKR